MDFQSTLAMMEDIEFEEKVDINDLILPSKPTESAKIEINEVKQEIKFKTLQKDKNVKHLLKQQQDEIAAKQSQFMIEKFEIESRYKEKLELLNTETLDDINQMKDSLKDLSIILARTGSGESGDMVTSARSELECPVCLEEMRPPKRLV